ncbi:hypothetical protein [Pararhizobium sp.]|uniref:hypothetical protein n=1 Tax=Pararhizobium sp. TaxID=1977563 RepID=UPI003D0F9D59
MSENFETIGELFNSYSRVMRGNASKNYDWVTDRDFKNVHKLLVAFPNIGLDAITYLEGALKAADEMRELAKQNVFVSSFVTLPAGYDIQSVDGEVVVTTNAGVDDQDIISVEEARRRTIVANMFLTELDVASRLTEDDGRIDAVIAKPTPVWHHVHGWIHSAAAVEQPDETTPNIELTPFFASLSKAFSGIRQGSPSRQRVTADFGVDVDEVDAENERDRARAAAIGLPPLPEVAEQDHATIYTIKLGDGSASVSTGDEGLRNFLKALTRGY